MTTSPEIPDSRRSEYENLKALLLESVPEDDRARDAAHRVAAACLRDGHLWRSMRFSDRGELRRFMFEYFPDVAAGNTKDMRWKKYLYKRLCGWPGFEG